MLKSKITAYLAFKRKTWIPQCLISSAVAAIVCFQFAVAGQVYAAAIEPLQPQPADNAIKSGLLPTYFRGYKSRHLDEFPKGEFARSTGRQGAPIPFLNHAFGKNEVFGSREKRLIGIRMDGLIRFPTSGSYQLRAYINDGIRLYINKRLIVNDPEWNKDGDRFTPPSVPINVKKGLWYPLYIEYFQRKGTATIKLYWKQPGSDDWENIPAEAYAHIPEDR